MTGPDVTLDPVSLTLPSRWPDTGRVEAEPWHQGEVDPDWGCDVMITEAGIERAGAAGHVIGLRDVPLGPRECRDVADRARAPPGAARQRRTRGVQGEEARLRRVM